MRPGMYTHDLAVGMYVVLRGESRGRIVNLRTSGGGMYSREFTEYLVKLDKDGGLLWCKAEHLLGVIGS